MEAWFAADADAISLKNWDQARNHTAEVLLPTRPSLRIMRSVSYIFRGSRARTDEEGFVLGTIHSGENNTKHGSFPYRSVS